MNVIHKGQHIKGAVKTPSRVHKLGPEQILTLLIYIMTYQFDYDCIKLGWKFLIKNKCIHINTSTLKIVWDIYNLTFTIIASQSQLPIDYLLCAIDRICEALVNFDTFLGFFSAEKYGDHYLLIKHHRKLRLRIIDEKVIVEGEINDRWVQHPICQKYFAAFYDILKPQ